MMRTCDGTDPNLVGIDGQPCKCGITFDDVNQMVVFPHFPILSKEEKERILQAWDSMITHIRSAWDAVQDDFEQTS